MKALSIRSPWWWFILHGAGKDIENRDWSTNYRGRILVHASSWWQESAIDSDLEDAIYIAELSGHPLSRLPRIDPEEMKASRGHIVGSVEITGCTSKSSSPWFFGRYGFELANPIVFPRPVQCRGSLGIFTVPDEVRDVIAFMESQTMSSASR